MSEEMKKILVCPTCGTKVTGSEESCPKCGLRFDEYARFECPICGTPINQTDSSCPSCKIEFHALPEDVPASSTASAMSEFESIEADTSSAEIPALEETHKKDEGASVGNPDIISNVCPVCRTVFSASEGRCPVCSGRSNTDDLLAAEKSLDEIEQLAESAHLGASDISASAQLAGLRDKAKSAKLNTIAPERDTDQLKPKQRKLRGLSNGKGATNGIRTRREGRVNGTQLGHDVGATNGQSMVNGTGILNGLRPSGARAGAGPNSIRRLATWQFLAVLIALLLIVPTMYLLQGDGPKSPFMVDGDFDEWEDSTRYGILVSSESPAINVIEWSVGLHSSHLYLYLRTESSVISSSRPESFTLFIDSDNSEATGYAVGGAGADLMLEVTGWNGLVGQASLSEFTDSDDPQDWSLWRDSRVPSCKAVGSEMEIGVELPFAVQEAARLILTSRDEDGPGCASCSIVLDGSLLVVEQMPAPEVTDAGILPSESQAALLRLKFSCYGSDGTVESVTPILAGVQIYDSIAPFALAVGQERTVDVTVDASMMSPGDFVSALVSENSIESTFTEVDVLGSAANAYVDSPPSSISIDGAFADWENIKDPDVDVLPVANQNIDIAEVGGVWTAQDSFFYVGVQGELLSGTYVPKACVIPSGSGGGGGVVIPVRRTAEDFLKIYIDADRSNVTGKVMSFDQRMLGAEYLIEIKGLSSEITSQTLYLYSEGQWTAQEGSIEAAKDISRMEIGVNSSAIGGATYVDFLVETTDWTGERDLASNDPTDLGTRRWVVDSSTTSAWATSMSYQRKLFYDGTNYWSFYYDGSNTVYKYSTDNGHSWNSVGSAFSTSGVNETSIWYDATNNIVYAVGDISTASLVVYIQRGSVSPGAHTITWESSDSTLAVSSNNLAGKNAYICKDSNGYLWVLSNNCSQTTPQVKYKLTAFKSTLVDTTTQWAYSGEMLSQQGTTYAEVRGSIVPAGTGSNVWSIYADSGTVYSKKFTGSWPTGATIIDNAAGTTENTLNAPPSVVVDNNGRVHVVYGDSTNDKGVSQPRAMYAYNNTGQDFFVTPTDLDSWRTSGLSDKYPTISLDSSTGDLYVFWARTDSSGTPQTIMGRKQSSGSWTNLTFDTQNTYTKRFLTSIYSAPDEFNICWQWTQNTTGTIHVIYDCVIPEFETLAPPIISIIAVCCILSLRTRTLRRKRRMR